MARVLHLLLFIYLGLVPNCAFSGASNRVISLYLDADWSNNLESAESIWRGVNTALSEVDNTVQGYKIAVVKKDHRGNVLLSRRNMTEFMTDQHALAIVSGIHSPPLLKYRTFINKNKLLTLVPWAAGGPVTRYPSIENWVFRVSLDDSQVGEVLVDFALQNKSCTSPHLLLENTPWGDSNLKSMSEALGKKGHTSFNVKRFDWNIKSYTALDIVQNIVSGGSDCVLLVANSQEGAEIAKAMSSRPADKRIPIISHWGITSGGFHQSVTNEVRKEIDLSFIQTCFSFMQSPLSAKGQQVLIEAKHLFPEVIKAPEDIHSPVGFIHGYDMTLLLLEALKQVVLTDNMLENRNAVRMALENIHQPVKGLIKTYQKPFGVFKPSDLNAHEALDASNYCMARYGEHDEINLIEDDQ